MKEAIKYHIKSIFSPTSIEKIAKISYSVAGSMRWLGSRKILLEKMLWGDEIGIQAAKYSRITKNMLRPSTPVSKTPHVDFLKRYNDFGEKIFDSKIFSKTLYYKNAKQAIDISGSYFGIRRPNEIVKQARRFIALYEENDSLPFDWVKGASKNLMPVLIRKIAYSDGYYQIVDGHHRVAISYVKGEKSCKGWVLRERAVLTPLQQCILDVYWTKGMRLLYQPISAPEIGKKWRLIRRCVDRMEMMIEFLRKSEYLPPKVETYMDLGSNYGWFVNEMSKLGFNAKGVDRDVAAVSLGPILYGIDPSKVEVKNLVTYLEQNKIVNDVTSCFSVLHHFVLGNASISAETMMKYIDRATGKVLFIDTGQNHELWFRHSLPEWDSNYIENWIKKNSTFTNIHRLGKDKDFTLPGQSKNYGRTLFACTR